jgi:hypothetical protein
MTGLSNIVSCMWLRPGAYPRVEHLKCASLMKVLVLHTDIRLGWKSLPGTNTPAYYKKLYSTALKSFMILAAGHNFNYILQTSLQTDLFAYFSTVVIYERKSFITLAPGTQP